MAYVRSAARLIVHVLPVKIWPNVLAVVALVLQGQCAVALPWRQLQAKSVQSAAKVLALVARVKWAR
ncbi:MAG: hypothetical protein A2788_01355 [Candidatus Abawacabacteria bacterium RIFCSPHIGHO2_01_FULL_46_8]|uniref:Uncharacterized protein n=1 Tax=Candidatus Abawacabacteria bacterium RIFCSPHIGHO2_01_FULL_46_8 TaxID=1817815 RepID=A0A1F4XMG1_9BACT|nr:MAG: hypothetical protein A2788_01355 [Candidatus Abawacabacteria bacterium RIFCSPHIGHO2_01_FULL_46_8]